jgi:hypothetical protein
MQSQGEKENREKDPTLGLVMSDPHTYIDIVNVLDLGTSLDGHEQAVQSFVLMYDCYSA